MSEEKDVPVGLRRRVKEPEVNAELKAIAEGLKNLSRHVHPPVPNPAPLGLIGFGLTTCLLQLRHTRIAGDSPEDMNGVSTVVIGFAMFFGGLLQLIAGISEIRRNNIFGYTAFCLYGGFWMSMGTIQIVSLLATGEAPPINPKAMQAMLFMVSIFTYALWILTFKLNKTICSLFFLLGTTCMLLSFGTRNETVDIIGGYFGIVTSVNAFWLAFVELVNDVIGEGQEIIPLGHWRDNKFKDSGAVHAPGRIQGHRVSLLDQMNLSTNGSPNLTAPEDADVERGEVTSESSAARSADK